MSALADCFRENTRAEGEKQRDIARVGRFYHPLEIVSGHGRVLYDESTLCWVLPGGHRTSDRVRALAVAQNVHDLTEARMVKERRA